MSKPKKVIRAMFDPVNSGLEQAGKKTKDYLSPKMPKTGKTPEAPVTDDAKAKIEARKKEALRRKKSGVGATVLTGSNTLG